MIADRAATRWRAAGCVVLGCALLCLALWAAPAVQATDDSPVLQPANGTLPPPNGTIPPPGPTFLPLHDLTSVAAGNLHTCAVTRNGGVKCWGWNLYGQLGDGTAIDRLLPVDVTGLSGVVQSVSAGGAHTCAVTAAGGVQCWGWNRFGALGDGSPALYRLLPGNVDGLASGVRTVSAGYEHTCAVTAAGGVKCWGRNDDGQLGDGTTTDRQTPVDVIGLTSGVAAVSAGSNHTCALLASGDVRCWGWNGDGRLGDNSQQTRLSPVAVVGLASSVRAVSAGYEHTCALLASGGVQCWGQNNEGQLGDGTREHRLVPVSVLGLSGPVEAISAGQSYTCAMTASGGAQCWGWNGSGQLGDGTSRTRLNSATVNNLASGVAAISANWGHTCVLTTSGGAQCWGQNDAGQLGIGKQTDQAAPVDVIGLASSVTAVSAGGDHTCALTAGGGVLCWGWNGYGQLGDEASYYSRPAPGAVSGLTSGARAVSAGDEHACALLSAGGVLCWGRNGSGELGDGTTTHRSAPVAAVGLAAGVETVSAGGAHTCALTTVGGVQCWGQNFHGQLGDGATYFNRSTPGDVLGLTSGVRALAAGEEHTCALTAAGGVKCWGLNDQGQLGIGTTSDRAAPVDVIGLESGAAAISANENHTCALLESGGVKCWGNNSNGQLGDGTTANRALPVTVFGLADSVQAISAGGAHLCALLENGGVQCWGWNVYGQLGDGARTDRVLPVYVTGFAASVQAISAGANHTCAVLATGGVQCWGRNEAGQLGAPLVWSPADVLDPAAPVKQRTYMPVIMKVGDN